MKKGDKGYRYVYSAEKAEAFAKLSPEERLEWLEKMNRFLYTLMPPRSREFREKLRQGKI